MDSYNPFEEIDVAIYYINTKADMSDMLSTAGAN